MSAPDYSFSIFIIMLCSISSCVDQMGIRDDVRKIRAQLEARPTDGAPVEPTKVRHPNLHTEDDS